jgi:hypothetical protein
VSWEPAGRRFPGGCEVPGPDGRAALTLRPNEFETRFFGRRIGVLEMDAAALAALPPQDRRRAVTLVTAIADDEGYCLVQAQVEAGSLELVAALEEAGFRLVDSRVEFRTRLDRRRLPRHEPPFGTAGTARPEDRDALLALAHEGLTRNPAFHSRYKNPDYFSVDDAARWFTAWVESDLADPDSVVAVWRLDEGPAAFFGLCRRGEHEGLPLYKSTLAVAASHRRGHKAHIFLQTTLFNALPVDEFWMQSVTQFTNGPVIRNNVAMNRHLNQLALVFFRRNPG